MSEQEPSDLELVRRANAGEREAFEALYVRYREWMLRCAHAVTRDEHLAQECVQEVTLYWLRKFPGFRLESKATTFLYPVVRHTALELMRKTRTLGRIDGAEELTSETASPDPATLDQALGRLSLEKREIIHLVVVEGLSLAHAAEAAGIPLGTAKSRLHNGLRELQDDPHLRREVLDQDS